MSVEKQLGENYEAAGQKQPDPVITKEKIIHTARCGDTRNIESRSPPTSEGQDGVSIGEIDAKAEPRVGPKRWFEGLSVDKRIAAMGFVDSSFLAMLLMLAAPSSTATGGGSPEDVLAHEGKGIDWAQMVSVKRVEELYGGNDTCPRRNMNVSAFEKCEGDQSLPQTSRDAMEEIEANDCIETDAFRIRSEKETVKEKPPPAAIESKDKDGVTKEDKNAIVGQLHRSVRAVFDGICVVFPSAFQHASGNVLDSNYPFVTLKPSFILDKNSKDEELFLALDSMSHFLCDHISFLSIKHNLIKSFTKTSFSWIELLKRRIDGDSVDKNVPLFALPLARFEYAVLEAYAEGSEYRHVLRSESVPDASSQSPSNDKSCLQFEVNEPCSKQCPSTQETNISSQRKAQPEPDISERISAQLKMIKAVVSSAKAVGGLSFTEGSETLKTFVDPFTKIFLSNLGPDISSPCHLENLLLTPLSWLLRTKRKDDGFIDFSAWNCCLDSALKRMNNAGSSIDTNEIVSELSPSHTVQDTETQQTPSDKNLKTTNVNQAAKSSESTSGQKKKRRNRKKKNKQQKPSNASSPASSDDLVSCFPGNPDEAVSPALNFAPTLSDVGKPRVDKTSESDTKSMIAQDPDLTEATTSSVQAEAVSLVSKDSTQNESVPLPDVRSDVTKSDITVSRVEGVLVVATQISEQTKNTSEAAKDFTESEKTEEPKDDGDEWETVEVRGRGNRKKVSDRSPVNNGRNFHHTSSSAAPDSQSSGRKKTKGSRTSQSRKRNAASKMIREILSSLLESVDEEVRIKKHSPVRPVVNPWKNGPPGGKSAPPVRKPTKMSVEPAVKIKKEATLRDVVLGRHTSIPKDSPSPQVETSPRDNRLPSSRSADNPKTDIRKKDPDLPQKISPGKRGKGNLVDQNTAPTYQETVSSSTINAVVDLKRRQQSMGDCASKCDSSSGGIEEVPQNRIGVSSTTENKDVFSVPPLPTLLSPENGNSATSSVTSSLEVPHAGHGHHSSSTLDANDVGYHLLDVCDRLSRDMSLFMSRRALALNTRRRERAALLASLQESVASIWPGLCHVEMYGSCATQLDLPASDLDVVVVGLDRNVDAPINTSTRQKFGRKKSSGGEGLSNSQSMDEKSLPDESKQHTQAQQVHMSVPPYMPVNMQTNSDRVMLLATELEGQPWAVQINAIPTASVPVIKVLADPSKLPGASTGSDWMAHHHQVAAQVIAAAGHGPTQPSSDDLTSKGIPTGCQQFRPQHAPPPWRGGDVMNGLLPLDITFEGLEHGGIGSTDFSARFVAEACQESGLHPDATPFVQVVMVLKELLVQRKLNEPYSGGLSSYALILLVVSLLRERAVIRKEIERVERQRKAVASGDSNSAFVASSCSPVASSQRDRNSQKAPEQNLNDITAMEQSSKPSGRCSVDNISSLPEKTQDIHSKKGAAKGLKSSSSCPQLDQRDPKKPTAKQSDQMSCNGPNPSTKKSVGSSWASIAKKNASLPDSCTKSSELGPKHADVTVNQHSEKVINATKKPATFAAAVARSTSATIPSPTTVPYGSSSKLKSPEKNPETQSLKGASCDNVNSDGLSDSDSMDNYINKDIVKSSSTDEALETKSESGDATPGKVANAASPVFLESAPVFTQGFNDIIEVLCSGETTAGKLLMHFLLFYGQHFDSQGTAIDISGKHERDFTGQSPPHSHLSPYIQRRAAGTIDPISGMLTVDPIVIYDPLEGAEHNNVARRCFAWSSVRWIFAQSYATLSSAVERSATPPTTPGGSGKASSSNSGSPKDAPEVEESNETHNLDAVGDLMDPASPLLRCLLSF